MKNVSAVKFSYNKAHTKFFHTELNFVLFHVIKVKMDTRVYRIRSCIRGYHVYRDVWTALIGEELIGSRQCKNSVDRYAVAVKKNTEIVGHIPKSISKVCSLFLRRGGSISCTVVGGRQYSIDLPQGGLEIPCLLQFTGHEKEIKKLKRCLYSY